MQVHWSAIDLDVAVSCHEPCEDDVVLDIDAL